MASPPSRPRPAPATQLSLFADLAPAPSRRRVSAPPEDPFGELLEALCDAPPDEEHLSRTRRLQRLVSSGAGAEVRLVLTDNRHSLLSWRWDASHGGHYVVRAHHMFLDAPDDVAHAVGRWMAQPRRSPSGAVIDRFMAEHRHLITRDRRPLAPPRGAHHDLTRIFERLNATEFAGAVEAELGWGEPGAPRHRRRRTIQLGCYDPEARTIIIHPALDQGWVPEFFVASVVFHEMLHQQVPARQSGDRRCVHGPEFKAREDAFHLTPLAEAWQQKHLNRLLRFQRRQDDERRAGRSGRAPATAARRA